MVQQVDIAEAQAHLSELLEKAIQGDEILITKDDKPLVRMSHVALAKPQPRFGSCQGMLILNEEDESNLLISPSTCHEALA